MLQRNIRRIGEAVGLMAEGKKRLVADHPNCAVCGGNKKVEVHHKHPFHVHPELELEPSNFITLCENDKDGVNCHLLFGHLGNFKSVNLSVEADAENWKNKIDHVDDSSSVTS